MPRLGDFLAGRISADFLAALADLGQARDKAGSAEVTKEDLMGAAELIRAGREKLARVEDTLRHFAGAA